jgi:hypothetical protein
MPSVKRFKVLPFSHAEGGYMEEDPNGRFVYWDDYERRRDLDKKQIIELESEVKRGRLIVEERMGKNDRLSEKATTEES